MSISGARYSSADTAKLLARLGDAAARLVLVGGQAVNFWAERYATIAPELRGQGPFTSKDIDFYGTADAATACAMLLGGRAKLADIDDATPNAGVILYREDSGREAAIDVLRYVHGIDARELQRTALPVDVLDDDGQPTGISFKVMHPFLCLESRVANLMSLPGIDVEQTVNQLRASVIAAREYARELIRDGDRRDALDLYQRLFRFARKGGGYPQLLDRHGIDIMVVVERTPELSEAFVREAYPRMVREIEVRRMKRRAAIARADAIRSRLATNR